MTYDKQPGSSRHHESSACGLRSVSTCPKQGHCGRRGPAPTSGSPQGPPPPLASTCATAWLPRTLRRWKDRRRLAGVVVVVVFGVGRSSGCAWGVFGVFGGLIVVFDDDVIVAAPSLTMSHSSPGTSSTCLDGLATRGAFHITLSSKGRQSRRGHPDGTEPSRAQALSPVSSNRPTPRPRVRSRGPRKCSLCCGGEERPSLLECGGICGTFLVALGFSRCYGRSLSCKVPTQSADSGDESDHLPRR